MILTLTNLYHIGTLARTKFFYVHWLAVDFSLTKAIYDFYRSMVTVGQTF